ncbi:MAG: class I SAM-dependent methyltransferase [Actinomycetota bacterium]
METHTHNSAASVLAPVLSRLLGPLESLRLEFWDGSSLGPKTSSTSLVLKSPAVLTRLLYAPGELGLARAYVSDDADLEGDIYRLFALAERFEESQGELRSPRMLARLLSAARRLGAPGRPPKPPAEEARLSGRLHSKERDRAAIAHHYDVGNDFYRLVLGQTMTYSCAYFETASTSLDQAQVAKYEHICRKLGLKPGMRLLDIGCGWGGMVLHAAEHHGVEAVGVTLSREQHTLASKRVADAGLAPQIEIRLQDYRDLDDAPFDAISSIGMFEHVGAQMMKRYFDTVYGLVKPGGRVLNHGISRPSGAPGFDKRSFIARYVFPDGELHEVGRVVSWMQECGFEVRDVESLREHYARTLRQWVLNLESNWDEAVSLVGEGRARVWRLYMAGSAVTFEAHRSSVHQVLAVKPTLGGESHMPRTRASFA